MTGDVQTSKTPRDCGSRPCAEDGDWPRPVAGNDPQRTLPGGAYRLRISAFGRLEALSGDAPAVEAEPVTAAVPRDLVSDDEVVILLLKPSALFIILAPLASVMFLLILTLTGALLAARAHWIIWSEEQAYLFGAVLIAGRLGWQLLDWASRVYVLTDRRIITRQGVLRVSVFETKLKSIQHTTVFLRIRERAFGLGSIGFATAGSDVFDTFWLMLRNPFNVHRTIVETIRRYGGGKQF